jgi:hypothetical protein
VSLLLHTAVLMETDSNCRHGHDPTTTITATAARKAGLDLIQCKGPVQQQEVAQEEVQELKQTLQVRLKSLIYIYMRAPAKAGAASTSVYVQIGETLHSLSAHTPCVPPGQNAAGK